jgi:membrane protease YdiL (CAAX protease family)
MGVVVEAVEASHAQAVVGLLFFAIAALAPLVFLRGQAPLLASLPAQDVGTGRSALGQNLDLVYTALWAMPLVLVGAGFPLRRSFRQALARLGVGLLRRSDVPTLLGLTLGLLVVGIGMGVVTDRVWTWAGWGSTDGALVQRLFGAPAASPLGIICIGLSAGLTEELLVRGLLQPRLGWLLPNVAFAAAHAFQYGADGVLTVFVIGAVQAGIRARWNTTAAVMTHSLYDTALLLAALVGVPGT